VAAHDLDHEGALMATASMPASRAVRTAARRAEFIPGASPPLVRMPSRCVYMFSSFIDSLKSVKIKRAS